MQITLTQLFRMVAIEKKVKNPEKWIQERLEHAEVETDLVNTLHLKSWRSFPFGIKDGKFECHDFVLYLERYNSDMEPNRMYEVYTFSALNDPKFNMLLQEAYNFGYDTITTFLLFFQNSPVNFKVKTNYGYATLGDYTDWDDYEGIEVGVYTISYEGSNITEYYKSKTMLELALQDRIGFFTEKTENGMKMEGLTVKYGSVDLMYFATEEDGKYKLVCLNENE